MLLCNVVCGRVLLQTLMSCVFHCVIVLSPVVNGEVLFVCSTFMNDYVVSVLFGEVIWMNQPCQLVTHWYLILTN